MRVGSFSWVVLGVVAAACGDDGGGRDASVEDGAVADGEVLDGSADAGRCIDAECGVCGRCQGEACVPVGDGVSCPGGACRDGECCTGCWDGTTCRAGDGLEACGARGGVCAACRCEGDACVEGRCAPEVAATDVSAGDAHTCAVDAAGRLWCWGRSLHGQVGTGEPGDAFPWPVRVAGPSSFAAVSAGASHTCALDAGGSLFCWGDNASGQLGLGVLGEGTERAAPERVSGTWSLVTTGGSHTCALGADGALSCWGENGFGQLGLGSTEPAPAPTRVGAESWQVLAAGTDHTCAIREDGTLWCWGRNTDYQLGLGTAGLAAGRTSPAQVSGETNFTGLTAGAESGCGLRTGLPLCWGRNRFGELGTGDTAPRRLPWSTGSTAFADADAGSFHACGVNRIGLLLCWGRGADGRLGYGGVADRPSPMTVDIAPLWSTVSAGDAHTCAIQTSGALFCWGDGGDGRLGTGDLDGRLTPARVCLEDP